MRDDSSGRRVSPVASHIDVAAPSVAPSPTQQPRNIICRLVLVLLAAQTFALYIFITGSSPHTRCLECLTFSNFCRTLIHWPSFFLYVTIGFFLNRYELPDVSTCEISSVPSQWTTLFDDSSIELHSDSASTVADTAESGHSHDANARRHTTLPDIPAATPILDAISGHPTSRTTKARLDTDAVRTCAQSSSCSHSSPDNAGCGADGDSTSCWSPRLFDRVIVLMVDALRFDFLAPNATALTQEQQLQLELQKQSRSDKDTHNLADQEPRAQHTHGDSSYNSSTRDGNVTAPPLPAWANKLPSVARALAMQPARSRLFRFVADAPTVTMQRLKGLTTGGLPTFLDIGRNFNSAAVGDDSWPAQLAAAFARQQQQHGQCLAGDRERASDCEQAS